jgi:hypothetical protein
MFTATVIKNLKSQYRLRYFKSKGYKTNYSIPVEKLLTQYHLGGRVLAVPSVD